MADLRIERWYRCIQYDSEDLI